METFFLEVLNRGISAGWLILVVILLRQFLGKAPKYIRMILWGIVAVRLICPCSIASVFSLIPSEQTIRPEIMQQQVPKIHSGVASIDGVLNPVIKKNFALNTVQNANPLQILIPVVSVIWLVGVGCMLFYMIMSFLRIHKKVAVSITYQDNVMLCDDIDSPFLFGMIKPRIFLPSTLEEGVLDSVIAHEKTHIKRRDHWWKPLGFAILAVYWFHPLVWASYLLFCRDMELACDEAVVKDMDAAGKKAYSNALLACSLPRKMIRVCPLAFGEDGVKMRVKSVLNYRKPTFWMMVTAGMLCIVIALCFLTNPAPKYLLKGIKAQDITSIKVFDGNNGQEFIIEEPKEIVEIVENFQSTPMKREKSSIGYMGYRFRMTFTDKEGKEIEQFILNQKNTIREDPFFYTSEQPLCYDYIEQLEQKYLGSASEESAKGNKRKEPPKLQVSYREDVVIASTLTYSWQVFNEDGTSVGMEADAPHPLDIIDRLPKLPIDYGSNQVFFTFKEDPETVTVRAWDISHDADKNTYDSNFIELEYEVYGEHLLAIPMDANYVYEVACSWDTEYYQGDASYSFVTEWREYAKNDWSLKAVDAPNYGSSTTVSAKDLYVDGDGYGWFQCQRSGTYRFCREGTLEDVALETREEIKWNVYLLAQPYNDVPRLLPQAYQAPVLIGDGDIFIKKGQYVVIYCSQNAYTYGLSGEFRGDEKAKYRCEFLSEKSQQSDEGMKQELMTKLGLEKDENTLIPCMYSNGEYTIFSAGVIEGTMGVFSGKFYVYDRKKEKVIAKADLTDSPEFTVIGDAIYYQKYRANDASQGLYRIDFGLTTEECVGRLLSIAYYDSKHDMIFAEKQPGEDNYCSQLVQITPDGTQLAVVFDPETLNGTYEKNDKVQYSDLSCDGKWLTGNVQHIGYRKGISIGWRDAVLEEEQIKVELH